MGILSFIIVELLPLIKNFKGKNILVVGDLILDCYIWGKVTRISPEAPVPVVDVTGDSFVLGGAANVANNIVSLGGKATVMGVVGRDRASETLRELLSRQGIAAIAVEDERPTTVKTRVIAHSQQVVRFDQENKEYVSGTALRSVLASIARAVKEHDAVIVSDYRKGLINPTVMRAIHKASGRKKFIAADPKVGHFPLYRGVSMITPNLMETASGAGMEIGDDRALLKAGMKLLKRLNLGAVLVTRGEQGMSLFRDSSVVHIPTVAKKVYDVTGAGDTVIAAFTLAHAAGASMEEAAVISNHAAGIVVGEVGTACATPERLRNSIRASRLKIERLDL